LLPSEQHPRFVTIGNNETVLWLILGQYKKQIHQIDMVQMREKLKEFIHTNQWCTFLCSRVIRIFISCITTANKLQGLTHKVVTNCLDTAKGISPTSLGGTAAGLTTTGSAAAARTGAG
jgi:hypothetical protein